LGPSLVKTVNTDGGPVFIRGDLEPKQIALTFDDGPHPRLTERLLEILKTQDVQATFFVLGTQALNNPNVLRAVAAHGHTVGTHTMDHPDLRKMSYEKGVEQISKAFESVLSILETSAPFFRFPYGAKTKNLAAFLKESDLAAFYWNMDSWDWKIKDPQKLFENCLREIEREQRGIMLFHDIHPQTIAVVPWVLQALADRGYKVVVYQPLEALDRHDAGPP
jgi:peptidoglycan/xylan/chitin deacetylase (PgdA/CDA1 family)